MMTLDVEMPRMDGVTFLRKFMPVIPTPTVVLSSLTRKGKKITIAALEAGAVDVMAKPASGMSEGLRAMMGTLRRKVKAAARTRVDMLRGQSTAAAKVVASDSHALEESTDRVIALGASTGGVRALMRILPQFPAATPGIVIVQHMPPDFTADFSERLNDVSRMNVKEAEEGDRVMMGQVLVSPGDRHIEVHRRGGEYRVRLVKGGPVSGHIPSVDVCFESIAEHVGKNAIGCLMTGIGSDGAAGLKKMREAGGATIAQDQASCVVYGMPRSAVELGAAEDVLPLEEIPNRILRVLRRAVKAA